MTSVLEKKVSIYKNYYTPEKSKDVSLIDILMLNNEKLIKLIEQIRAEPDKEKRDQLKAKIFCFTPSGTFTSRSEAGLIRHSGFLQFDIDFKDNQHIKNYSSLKDEICNVVNVAYCGLSASGRGYWGLIPIAYPEQHKEHFEVLKRDFEGFGIMIDEKPKNVASLRGYSWDPDAYFNHNARIYTKTWKREKAHREFTPSCNGAVPRRDDTRQKVEQLIVQIRQSVTDITGSYGTWFELGCSLANEFGESGREYFHLISQYHPDYRENATDKQFSHCLKHNYQYQINTFFHYCKQSGILMQYERKADVQILTSSVREIPVTDAPNDATIDIPKRTTSLSERITHSANYLQEMAAAGTPF